MARRADRRCRLPACCTCGRGPLHLQVDSAVAACELLGNCMHLSVCSTEFCCAVKPQLLQHALQVSACVVDRRHLREHQRAGVSFLWECTMGLREAGRLGAILAGASAALSFACKLHAVMITCMSNRHET